MSVCAWAGDGVHADGWIDIHLRLNGVGNCWLMQVGIELVVFSHRLILVN